MKTFRQIINETKEQTLNVNIGIDKERKDFKKVVAKIKKEIETSGGYFDNEGSDENTYNINVGFSNEDIRLGRAFAKKIGKLADYVETDLIDM